MKILLQSTLFYPSVGGIETVSRCLAEGYTSEGHFCTVLTRTESAIADHYPYQIKRNPGKAEKEALVKAHDIIHCNGASLELVWLARKNLKPIIWTHAGYQMVSIDGLGWYEGMESPLSPFSSFLFHLKHTSLKKAITGYSKLLIRRAASRLISRHVAITKWVATRQPLPGQEMIYNPFPIDTFRSLAGKNKDFEYDFFFLGRLVSEKGVGTLLKAFQLFLYSKPDYNGSLLIIGDGNWREKLVQLARELQIEKRVVFAGRQTGTNLLDWVSKGKIAIIPSEWEEPMGGVAVEMLAADKLVIVSQNGGLAECVGEAGLTFPNGDHLALSEQMIKLFENKSLQEELLKNIPAQLSVFNQKEKVRQYLDLFTKILNEK